MADMLRCRFVFHGWRWVWPGSGGIGFLMCQRKRHEMSVPGLGDGLPVELVSRGAHGYAPSVSASWPPLGNGETVLCRVCPYGPTPMGGRVNRHLSQRRLVALLREATGIDEVEPDRRPWTGATVRLDTAIRTKSTQRISLQQQDDSLALSTFPAELKLQAEALYRTGRAQRLMDLVAEHPEAWRARPNLQLAFRNAPVAQRLARTKRDGRASA